MKVHGLLLTLSLVALHCVAKKSHHVDLRHHGLRAIPKNIPPTTENLDLSSNLLQTIPNDSFVELTVLSLLHLSRNKLAKLEPSAFAGLSRLHYLNLEGNNLLMGYASFPASVFHPLKQLKTLKMATSFASKSPGDHHFLDAIFRDLGSLKELSIDGPHDGFFGPGVMRMSQLKKLNVHYWEYGGSLTPETFSYFAGLPVQSLVLSTHSLEKGTLGHFPFLTNLSLTTNGITKALSALADLKQRNMTSVKISGCNPNFGGVRDVENLILTSNNTAHLADMCVRHLDLSNNALIHVGIDVLFGLRYPECVESLKADGNYLSIASHTIPFFLFFRFSRLQYLSISPGRHFFLSNEKRTSDYLLATPTHGQSVSVALPSSLRVLNASYIAGFVNNIPDVNVINAHNLQVLDLSFDGIIGCSIGISGLENLKVLNMSGFDCSFLSPKFFGNLKSLDVLVAKNCRLNIGFQQKNNAEIFRNLTQLRTLDLSSNDFVALATEIFTPLTSLENLIIADNKLIHLPESMYRLKLKFLDLSSNVISSLSRKEMNWFNGDFSPRTSGVVSVSLSQNPFMCTCNTLDTMHWLLESSAIVEGLCSLTCTLENGTVVKMCSIQPQLKNMDVSCVSKFWLTFSVVGSCLLTVLIVLGIFAYRYRWNIKYWVLTKFRRGPVYEEVGNEQYKYDAFVAYNYSIYRWACINLRKILEDDNNFSLCLHDRDFIPGGNIQQSIVDAMNNSRKIILVINKAFMKSEWCEFEVQMAGLRMARDGREDAIIVIMMEEIPVTEMSKSLLGLWKKITFLMWPGEDPGDERIFWSRLLDGMAR